MDKEIKDANGFTEKQFLENYSSAAFEHPSVTTDIVIFTVQEEAVHNIRALPKKTFNLLLIRRGEHPYLGCWALPGGFVAPGETLKESAAKKLKEETNVDTAYLEQLYTFSAPGRDPREWVISCSHMALTDSSKTELKHGAKTEDVAWFELQYEVHDIQYIQSGGFSEMEKTFRLTLSHKDIKLKAQVKKKERRSAIWSEPEYEIVSNENLAFDHAKIIVCALERLRGKIEYTDIAFALMPDRFTLTSLQTVYETILGKKLATAAFRRKIASMVVETDGYTEPTAHRPSRLYRRREFED